MRLQPRVYTSAEPFRDKLRPFAMTLPAEPAGPPHLTSRYPLVVRFCETDLMGIVHHANYLTYFEAGRVDWLQRRGIAYGAWTQRGIHLAVAETRLKYRMAARFGDQLIVETTCHETRRATVLFTYRILRDTAVLCDGETLLACVGAALTLQRIPADIVDVFSRPETSGSV